MITKINEFKEQLIRISSASLASINIDGLYLLCMNNSQFKNNIYTYTPFGGAIEYNNEALPFLNSLNVTFERSTPDLRFTMKLENLVKYEEWFNKKIDREVGIDRELIEEFVDEENILQSLTNTEFTSKYINTVKDNQYYNGIENYRYFEIYTVEFNNYVLNEIKNKLNSYSNTDIKKIALISKEEILNGYTNDGIKIGDNSKSIII